MKQQYIDLAERCEAADAGSRELDGSIWHEVVGKTMDRLKFSPNKIPHYTTSLDAAMTLLPINVRFRLQVMEDGRGAAVLWPVLGDQPADPWMKLYATPALALLAAICRAMGEG